MNSCLNFVRPFKYEKALPKYPIVGDDSFSELRKKQKQANRLLGISREEDEVLLCFHTSL